ncbi:CoA transferase [Dactylosporangium sp. NPDC000555]|uniref:CoA transferase n=1 Tax=Dactylosporangium sp. NPDC000555 TaxID=3154260 RepID=UPI00332ACB33
MRNSTGPLHGLRFAETGASRTAGYAGRLLAGLGATVLRLRTPADPPRPDWYDAGKQVRDIAAADVPALIAGGGFAGVVRAPEDPEPLADWAAAGALFLRGPRPQAGPGRLLAHLRGAALAARLLGLPVDVAGDRLPGERAALRGAADAPAAERCRLYRVADGHIAVNLARDEDLDLIPAWLVLAADSPAGADGPVATREAASALLDRLLRAVPAERAVAAAQELGLAVAPVAAPREAANDAQARARGQAGLPAPWRIETLPGPPASRAGRPPLVVDLTGLWAGPLSTGLLAACGARVVKVEGPARPDGARGGDPRFFDLLNAGKRAVALDLRSAAGRAGLDRLLRRADVVVESLRPRVTEQLGIDPHDWLATGPGRVWASITGYGRTGPWRNRVAFGDDAAAAAGVAVLSGGPDRPELAGDALADPVTGLHALVAILAARADGRSHLVDIAMREALGHALGDPDADPECRLPDLTRLRPAGGGWLVDGDPARPAVAPQARTATGRAPGLGADTDAVLAELAQP